METKTTESYLLTPTQSLSQSSTNHPEDHHPEEDLHPDSDASLLRKHRDEEDDHDGEDEQLRNITSPRILGGLMAFMSQTLLLPGSSQAQETSPYGALAAPGPTGSGDIDEEEEEADEDRSLRGRRKGKISDMRHVDSIRPTRSVGTLRSPNDVGSTRCIGTLRSLAGSASVSRRRTRKSEPAPENIYASGTGLPTGDGAKVFEGLAPTLSTEDLGTEEAEEEEDGDEESLFVDGEDSEADDEDPPDNSPLVHSSSGICALPQEMVSGY